MGIIDDIKKLAKDNNGIITSSMIDSEGFSRGNLLYLRERGEIEQVSRGVYILPETWEDEFFNLQNRFKKGIFSHETALFLWDLTDRTPNFYSMTFPSTYNVTNPKKAEIHCSQCKPLLYELGLTSVSTPSGNRVNVYNPERTLCDILRPRSNVDIQILTDAFKRYVSRSDKNIPLLSNYGKMLKVETKLRMYLEVLL